MKPHTVVNINISINSETPKEHLSKLEIDVMRLHIRDYIKAGQPMPERVIERARQMGIEVKA